MKFSFVYICQFVKYFQEIRLDPAVFLLDSVSLIDFRLNISNNKPIYYIYIYL